MSLTFIGSYVSLALPPLQFQSVLRNLSGVGLAAAFPFCHSCRMHAPRATVEIYADGAASPNPGAGGYGVLIQKGAERTELSGGYRQTTNNRMELRAAIEGLRALGEDGLAITLYSDARYVVDMINGGHAQRWRANRWMRNGRDRAENPDLWEQLLDLCGRHQVRFEWVKGHNAHAENERCDQLAVEARRKADLPADDNYEKALKAQPEQTLFAW